MNELGHMPVNQRVYHRILQMILSGSLTPGSRLDEQSLSTDLGVSRTPLREAIGRLSEKGLIEYRPYQGNFIRVLSVKEVSDIYQVRRTLEELAIRLATANMDEDRLATVAEILDELDAAMKRGDLEGVNEADNRFHSTIARFSENETLISALNDLSQRVAIIRTLANQNPEIVAQTAIQRPQILAALESGNADLAAALLGEHIEFVGKAVIEEQRIGANEAASS